MSRLSAYIRDEAGQPWLYVTAPSGVQGGAEWIVFDAPVDVRSKHTVKVEIDYAHERSGMPRPDLYDVFRAYQHPKRGEGEAA